MKKAYNFVITWFIVCIGFHIFTFMVFGLLYAAIMFKEIFIVETSFSGSCSKIQFNSKWFFDCSPDIINPYIYFLITIILTLCIINYSHLKKALQSVVR